ncbi:MAG: hypothetical protein GY898_22240 [Proteobacteria bacterium]|nr:hypothetical protein [Pseudomonadota bacterium]
MLRRAVLLMVLAVLLAGCPEDRRKRVVPGGRVELADFATELVVDLKPRSASIDGPVRLLLLGWDKDELNSNGHPKLGGQPSFAWRSEGLKPEWPIRLAIPMPPHASVLIVRDANANGRMDEGERIAGPVIAPVAPLPAIDAALDRNFVLHQQVQEPPSGPSGPRHPVEPSSRP